jgi:FkbM family methyltransferase
MEGKMSKLPLSVSGNTYNDFTRAIALEGEGYVVFGAGLEAVKTIAYWGMDISSIRYFVDNDPRKQNTLFCGKRVLLPEALHNENLKTLVVLIASDRFLEITSQLESMKVHNYFVSKAMKLFDLLKTVAIFDAVDLANSQDRIKQAKALLSDDRSTYLFDEILKRRSDDLFYGYGDLWEGDEFFNDIFADSMRDDEVYVDAGVYKGNDIFRFIIYSNNRYQKIYGFEPNSINYEYLKNEIKLDNIEILPYALSSKNEYLSFERRSINDGASHVTNSEGFEKVRAVKLDDAIAEHVTLITLDVEGSELEVLKGAIRILSCHKPKLAISVYHRISDFWNIILFLKEQVPEYKFYLRHHSNIVTETILYAKI